MTFDEISTALGERIEDLLISLQIDVTEYGDKWVGACPCHGSDNPTTFNLSLPESEYPLTWVCWSRECASHFGRGLIGLTRGVLSHQTRLWNAPGDDEISWSEWREWIDNFLGGTVPKNTIIKKAPTEYEETPLWSEFEYRKQFSIPSRYYLKRGFSDEVLSRYLVADSNQYGTLYKRAIIPLVRDRQIYGISSRSMLPECKDCGCHHQGVCPEPKDRHYPSYIRWAHKGFKKRFNLYNYEERLDWIRAEKTTILCESPNSVLKMEDAGIPGCLATFGCKVSKEQLEKLAQIGVNRIILMMDNDLSGLEGMKSITQRFGNDFQFIIPTSDIPPGKDIADYPTNLIKKYITQDLKRINYPI